MIGCIIVAAVSTGRPVAANTATRTAGVYRKELHQFDSSGLCTCLPFASSIKMEEAPRIQLNKNVAGFVKQYNKKNGYFLNKEKKKVDHYFTIIDSVLEQHGLPGELKYLAYIESGLKKNAHSRSGAIGPWALMPVAGKQYGLRVGGSNDERLHYGKSTHAAAKLLNDLYDQFGDWLLVIAAYNSGPGWIQKAIKRSGSKNYWSLQQYLPKETQSHIRRFIAVHYQFEGHGSVVTLSKAETIAHEKAVAEFMEKQTQLEAIDTALVVKGF
jgi:membrane-bound lytic murein transglycosylase D